MRKITFLVTLGLLAVAPIASAQQPRGGYYDQYGRYHEFTQNDGYYDRNGVWHSNTTQTGGYYDRNGVWHPTTTAREGYYDRNGVWQATPQGEGYYDRDGVWRPNAAQNGYYDRSGVWHPNAAQGDGYYDNRGVWHPNTTQTGGYYDQNGQWHPNGNDRYGRAVAPERWTFNERGRSETLVTAARNLSLTADAVYREAYRRSSRADVAALEALRRLDEQTKSFARQVAQTQQRRRDEPAVGEAYANLVANFFDARQRFAALDPDGKLSNQFQVLSSAIGRLDKRYFGSRAFGGQNPANMAYGYEQSYSYEQSYGYDRYGNPLPAPVNRDGRDTRPQRP